MGREQRLRQQEGQMELEKGVLDARGRTLQEGDEILLDTPGHPVYFRVARIVPVLDPKLPQGLLQIDVIASLPFVAQRGQVNPQFIRVRTLAEAGPLKGLRVVEGRDQADPETHVIAEQGPES